MVVLLMGSGVLRPHPATQAATTKADATKVALREKVFMPELLPHHAREGQRMPHRKGREAGVRADFGRGGCSTQLGFEHTDRGQHLSKAFDAASFVFVLDPPARILERRYQVVDLICRDRQGAQRFTDRVERHMIGMSR
ncbi:hypothetical protein LZC94_40795 [Pendulispora albinea]|uniref:PilZ domain-containing protein n=1 Tax=Pendulispora albinea TaxID=2741071 RepID=A0ABZ2LYL2_9BACT